MIRRLAEEMSRKNRLRHLKAGLSSALLLGEAAIVAASGTGIWYLIWTAGYHLEPESEVRISTIILLLGGVFAIAAAITLTETVSKSMAMSRFVLLKDEKEFMVLRDMHIPRRMHVVLGSFGGGALVLISIFGYANASEGMVAVFICYFAFTVYFSATLELQDPMQSAWFRGHAPPPWLTDDVDTRLTELQKPKRRVRKDPPRP